MENARLITEQREALEQQTATAEMLQVINASPGDLTPVFDAMLDGRCGSARAAFGTLFTFDGEFFHPAARRPAIRKVSVDRPFSPRRNPAGRDCSRRAVCAQSPTCWRRRGLPFRRSQRACDWWIGEGARTLPSGATASRRGAARVLSRSIARRYGRSPTSRSRCCRTSPPRR